MSRLTCIRCGADLGDADDPYRDPDCAACIARDAAEEVEEERGYFCDGLQGRPASYCCEWFARFGAVHDPDCPRGHRYIPCRADDDVAASERCGECGGSPQEHAGAAR